MVERGEQLLVGQPPARVVEALAGQLGVQGVLDRGSIDVEAAGLFAGVRGRQIAGRFTVIPATAFAYGTADQREQWRALVATMESTLRLHKHKPGSLVALDEYLYRRSGGMIGSLS